MIVYLKTETREVIVGTNTKASKYIKNNYTKLGLIKVLGNFSAAFGSVEIDFSGLGYSNPITATKYAKDNNITIS